MNDTLLFALSLSIVFAALIGVIRYKQIDASYHPFVYYACLALIVEILVHLLLTHRLFKVAIGLLNFYSLAEFYLFTWMFHRWGLFKFQKKPFVSILVYGALVWLVLTLYPWGMFGKQNLYFLVAYSFVLIFFSISAFNKMVVLYRGNIFSNPKFWFCLGIIIFYTYFIVSTTARLPLVKGKLGPDINEMLQGINVYANLLVNLLYAVALLWIPRKKNIITLL